MEQMKIAATKNSPLVELSPDGDMIIQGRAVLEDPSAFFNPIIAWIPKCSSKNFTLEIRMEYLNTSSTKLLINLFKAVKANYNSSNVIIKWYYESDDEDMLDMGKDFESLIRLPIDFYELQTDVD